jgi:hypothetical protein
MGSGHVLGDETTVISPGPVYDTRERPVRDGLYMKITFREQLYWCQFGTNE